VTNLVLTPSRRTTAAGSRPSVLAVRIGLAGIVCSLLFMTRLTVAAWDRMSVLNTTMSDYAYVPTFGWMFGASVLCIGFAGIGAMAGLATIRLLDGVLLKLALGLAVLGSVLAAMFRTDLGESLSTSAQIHRYAAGVVFFCVPIATFLVARGLTGVGYLARDRKLLYANVIVTSIVLTLFMTSHFGVMPELLQELNGVFQRVLFVLELVLLGQLTLLPLRFRVPRQHVEPHVPRQRVPGRRYQPRGSGAPSAYPDADWTPTTAFAWKSSSVVAPVYVHAERRPEQIESSRSSTLGAAGSSRIRDVEMPSSNSALRARSNAPSPRVRAVTARFDAMPNDSL